MHPIMFVKPQQPTSRNFILTDTLFGLTVEIMFSSVTLIPTIVRAGSKQHDRTEELFNRNHF